MKIRPCQGWTEQVRYKQLNGRPEQCEWSKIRIAFNRQYKWSSFPHLQPMLFCSPINDSDNASWCSLPLSPAGLTKSSTCTQNKTLTVLDVYYTLLQIYSLQSIFSSSGILWGWSNWHEINTMLLHSHGKPWILRHLARDINTFLLFRESEIQVKVPCP